MSKLLKFTIGIMVCFNLYLGYTYLKDKPFPGITMVTEVKPTINTDSSDKIKKPKSVVKSPADLTYIHSFGYYTSKIDPDKVMKSGYEMMIVNEADSNSNLFTKDAVTKMKSSGKVVLAEVSVGYAENYRWYWKKEWTTTKPSFLGDEYTPNQFYVKEWWNPEWWQVTTGIIDKAMEAGFDGVVLEGIDVYIDLGASKAMRDKMIDYVIAIAQYAKSKNPSFAILPKNAELLGKIPEYVKAVDGLVKEDLIYSSISNGNTGPKNGFPQINKGMNDLNEFKKLQKPVFVIEYVSGKSWDDAKALLKKNGYTGYSSPSRSPASIRESIW